MAGTQGPSSTTLVRVSRTPPDGATTRESASSAPSAASEPSRATRARRTRSSAKGASPATVGGRRSGRSSVRTSWSAVLPSQVRWKAPRPWVVRTTRSASSSLAASLIVVLTRPTRTWASTGSSPRWLAVLSAAPSRYARTRAFSSSSQLRRSVSSPKATGAGGTFETTERRCVSAPCRRARAAARLSTRSAKSDPSSGTRIRFIRTARRLERPGLDFSRTYPAGRRSVPPGRSEAPGTPSAHFPYYGRRILRP